MIEYLEPAAMKFIIVTAAVAAIVAIADAVLIMRRKGRARMEGLLPAVDSVLVIAGFMAFVGAGIALIQSAGKIAEIGTEWSSTFTALVTALTTVMIAWTLFFVFFEVWYLLRFMIRRDMKKVTAT